PDGGYRDGRPGRAARSGPDGPTGRRSWHSDRRGARREHGVRLPPPQAGRRDEDRQHLHRPRARRRRSCPRRAPPSGRRDEGLALARPELSLPDALHGRHAAERRPPQPRRRADHLPTQRIPERRVDRRARARRVDDLRLGDRAVSSGDLACAREFLDVLAEAARTGDREAVYALLTPDVEWLTPKRDVRGIDAAREEL